MARPNLRLFHDDNWLDRAAVEGEKRLDEFIDQLAREEKKVAILEIGAGASDPRIKVSNR